MTTEEIRQRLAATRGRRVRIEGHDGTSLVGVLRAVDDARVELVVDRGRIRMVQLADVATVSTVEATS